MVSLTSSDNAVAVVGLSQWTLNFTKDKFDATAFQDGNKVYTAGFKDVAGTYRGWMESGDHRIFDATDAPAAVKAYAYPDIINLPSVYFYGLAWIDSAIDVGVGGTIAVSGSISAGGSWGRNWP
jgi:hypothetical protein